MKVEELFVPVTGYENIVVSNYGRVINVRKDHDLMTFVGEDSTGREMLCVMAKKRSRAQHLDILFVADLVAEAFFVDYHEDVDIFYKNGNRLDCTVLNLTFNPEYKEKTDG